MSGNDGSGGSRFLDRLARFIRHPTMSWAQSRHAPGTFVDPAKAKAQQREAERALRAAALIREREFDALRREMRNHRARAGKPLEGLSIPSTLPPPVQRNASRQQTLHKIDAIERQIQGEQQRQFDTTIRASRFAQSNVSPSGFVMSAIGRSVHRPAQPSRWRQSRLHQAERQRAPSPNPSRRGRAPDFFSTSLLSLPAVIELASFDFAEGRDTEVESQLLTGLQTTTAWSADGQITWQALLDFYWATGQQDKLQNRSLEYVQRYGQTPIPRPLQDEFAFAADRRASFVAAEVFDVLQQRAFESFVAEPSHHLVVDWSGLVSIPERQRPALTQALCKLNSRAVKLELIGVDMLLSATRLQKAPPSAVDADLRLQVFRLLHDESSFVDLAVEQSIACACSPVDWIPPRHTRTDTAAQRATTVLRVGDADAGFSQVTIRLGGGLSGSGESFLRDLRAQAQRADAMIVELDAVRRMDFAAATALLNWADAQRQLGKSVEIRGAHVLLRPFLQSIGLQLQD